MSVRYGAVERISVIIIIIDDFCIALFSGVPKLTALFSGVPKLTALFSGVPKLTALFSGVPSLTHYYYY